MKAIQKSMVTQELVMSGAIGTVVEAVLRELITGGVKGGATAGQEYRLRWDISSRAVPELDAYELKTVLQMEEVVQGAEMLWTRCSDYMPVENEQVFGEDIEYLVQDEDGEINIAYYCDGKWVSRFGYELMNDIIAWRRLPEKYGEEIKEDE